MSRPATRRFRPRRGLAASEAVLAGLCMAVLAAFIVPRLGSGGTAPGTGGHSPEVAREACSILTQVQDDLRNAVPLPVPLAPSPFRAGTPPVILIATATPTGPEFSFWALAEPLSPPGNPPATWPVTRITYRLERSPAQPATCGRLLRLEAWPGGDPRARAVPGGVQSRVLSERVGFFHLSPQVATAGDRLLTWVGIQFQLVSPTSQAGPAIQTPGPEHPDPSIGEFFGVARPTSCTGARDREFFIANWHTRPD